MFADDRRLQRQLLRAIDTNMTLARRDTMRSSKTGDRRTLSSKEISACGKKYGFKQKDRV
jgi:hypothetical protein